MTRPEVITKAITKQLSWVLATEILEISAPDISNAYDIPPGYSCPNLFAEVLAGRASTRSGRRAGGTVRNGNQDWIKLLLVR
jgi:hypothetical protein